jgi:hypothetical protein
MPDLGPSVASLHQQALDLHERAWGFMCEVEQREGRGSNLYRAARSAMLWANECIGLALSADRAVADLTGRGQRAS